jgi:hypothetical protein
MFPLRITTKFTKPPEASVRQWRACMKEAFEEQGRVWHSEFLPRHFEPYAAAKYGYQDRGKKYQQYKELAARGLGPYRYQGPVLEGGKVALVFTGLLKRTMIEPARIRAFPTRVTIRMIGPRYITMKPYKTRQPDKAAEITTVLPAEQRKLDKVLGDEVHKRFAEAPGEPLIVKVA